MAAGPLDPIAEARRQWAAHGWAEVADGMAALTSVMRAQQLLLARCDAVLRIPMRGFVPAYNLQAAMAMVAGERLRQEADESRRRR